MRGRLSTRRVSSPPSAPTSSSTPKSASGLAGSGNCGRNSRWVMVCAMAWFASDHLREVAGSGTDFTGLFFIVTWIDAIALRLRFRVRAHCTVVKLRQLLVISRDALPAIVSDAAAD